MYTHRLLVSENAATRIKLLLSNRQIQRMHLHIRLPPWIAIPFITAPIANSRTPNPCFFHRNFAWEVCVCFIHCVVWWRKVRRSTPEEWNMFSNSWIAAWLVTREAIAGLPTHMKVLLLSKSTSMFSAKLSSTLLQVLDKLSVYSRRIKFSIRCSHFHLFALIICRNGVALLLALQMGHIPILVVCFCRSNAVRS